VRAVIVNKLQTPAGSMFRLFHKPQKPEAPAPEPIERAAAPVPPAVPEPVYGDVDLGLLFGVLLRQWLFIAFVTALFVGAGFAYLSVATKVWQSTARVLLDPRDKQVVGAGVTQPVQGIDTFWIDTQADVVQSTATLDAVIDRLNLMQDGDFSGSRDITRRKLAEAIKVERADQTYVLDINVFTSDPGRSTRIAQAVAESFVDGMIAIKADAVRQASSLIDHQLDELRDAARAAQERLEAYKRDEGLLSANGHLVDEDTLRQLNDAYVAAQVKTREARARADGVAAALKSGDLGGLDTANSAFMSRLKIENAQAVRTLNDLSQQLGPNHPRLAAAQADVNRTKSLINAELKSLSASASGDYDVALANETSAKQAVDAAAAVVAKAGQAGIKLKELENEATLRADMYRNYMTRTAEIGLQAKTQVSDARVIVPANAPIAPYSPRKTIVLGLAGVAGLGLALSLAVYRGRRRLIARLAERAAPRAIPVGTDAAPVAPVAPAVMSPSIVVPVPPPAAIATPSPAPGPEPTPDTTAEPASEVAAEPIPEVAAEPIPEVAAASVLPAVVTQEPQPVAADAEAVVAPVEAGNGAPQRVPVLAELQLDTAASGRNKLGRTIVRRPRDVLASAVELAAGKPDAAGEARIGKLIDTVAAAAGATGCLATIGVSDSACAAAVAYGLAQVEAREKAGVLLVDAAYDKLPLAAAYVTDVPPGIIDVLEAGIDAANIAICPDERDITVIAVGGAASAERIDARADDIATFITELAADYGRLVLHFGHHHSMPLLEALIGKVDAVLVVAEAVVEADAESRATIAELTGAIPGYAGLVLVSERAAPVGA
jgi:uncharacterized protein involved in exopolysaccharide biosynthesis